MPRFQGNSKAIQGEHEMDETGAPDQSNTFYYTEIDTRKCELYFNEFNGHKTYRYFSQLLMFPFPHLILFS